MSSHIAITLIKAQAGKEWQGRHHLCQHNRLACQTTVLQHVVLFSCQRLILLSECYRAKLLPEGGHSVCILHLILVSTVGSAGMIAHIARTWTCKNKRKGRQLALTGCGKRKGRLPALSGCWKSKARLPAQQDFTSSQLPVYRFLHHREGLQSERSIAAAHLKSCC